MFTFVVLCSLISVLAFSPEPKDWPEQFSVSFVSNITLSGNGNGIKGQMWYDWTNGEVQRVDHEAGAVECVEFYNTAGPCTLFFTPNGLFRQLQEPMPENAKECCLDLATIYASRPDWATKGNPSYGGVVKDPYSGVDALLFRYDNLPASGRRLVGDDKEPHLYYETLPKEGKERLPLIFTFPGKDGIQDYHFTTETFKIAHQDPSIFELPMNCGEPCEAA